jgi:hypothetical protein
LSQGIRILLRENAQGQVYGITFIDNATRAVFNGSDLGKAYSAKAFMERLPVSSIENKTQIQHENKDAAALSTKVNSIKHKTYPAFDQPVVERLIDVLLSSRDTSSQSDPFRRKKKRRLLS